MKSRIKILMAGLLGLSSLCSETVMAQTWSLTGNAGTNAGTNFIGTTDNIALRFRTNNSIRMSISSGGKVGIGILVPIFKLDVRAGSINTDSLYRINGTSVLSLDNSNRIQLGDATVKVGIGTTTPTTALQVAGTATATEFVGGGVGITSINASNLNSGTVNDSRLSSNVALKSGSNTFTGSNSFSQDVFVVGVRVGNGSGNFANNTVLGAGALASNLSGENNTALGAGALASNVLGESNTAIGVSALLSNTDGYGNTANGINALFSNTTGNYNTASGFAALNSNTTGSSNTAYGGYSLNSNQTGFNNTAMGYSALYSNTTGYENTANGNGALYANTTGFNNTANGNGALYSNTTGSFNTANGYQALYINTVGSNNTVNGYKALYSNTTGYNNIANGNQALYSNTNGVNNAASGYQALYSNTTGYSNTANGSYALFNNTSGFSNTANGRSALSSNTSGAQNIAVGVYSLYYDSTASGNVALGFSAGDYAFNGNGNTFIGFACAATTNGLTNTSSLGYNTRVDASNKVRIGNTSITSIGGQVGWTTFSDGRYKRNVEEDVPGLEFISKLRPVTYTTDITGLDNHYPKPALREGQEMPKLGDVSQQEKIRYSGFIAQEVEAAANEIGYDFSGVDKPQKEGNLYGIRYAEFVVPMVKAIQEQQKQIEELKAALAIKNNSGAIKLGVNDGNAEILLGQNIPNPVDNSTIIPFSIPSNCKSASILITDLATGRAIKAVPLSCKDTHLMLDAGSLASGTYSYTLFVDGASVDTKQMVIVK